MAAVHPQNGAEKPGVADLSRRGFEIELRQLKKVFHSRDGSETVAVDDTTVKFSASQFVSIVGPSGCGKSTIMRMIAGLIPPTSGTVVLGGKVVTEPSPAIGIAFQRAVLLPWLSVNKNVALPAELEKRWSKTEIANRVETLLDMVKLAGIGNRFPSELSGGMQQRVSIARALMTDPDVFLMDEPFGALDALTREHMNDELLTIWERSKATVVFITHDIGEAVYLSDRVLVMATQPGRIIADIPIDLSRPRKIEVRGDPEFIRVGMEIRSHIPR